MTLTTCSVLELGLDPSAVTLNRGFADYRVPIQFTAATLTQAARIDGVDLVESRILLHNEEPVGVALIARRGWRSRLAAMAIAREARGQGAGQWFVTMLIEEAKARGDRQMVLEVIADNIPAVRLYERVGFETVRQLVSFYAASRPSPNESVAAVAAQELAEVDLYQVAAVVAAYGLPDLPWQLAGATLAQLGPPHCAYRLADAYIVLSDPSQESIGIRSLIVEPQSRKRRQAQALLHAIQNAYPQKGLRVPALWPAELGTLFVQAGFLEDSLSQLQMQLSLQ